MPLSLLLALPVIAYLLLPMNPKVRYALAAMLLGGIYSLFWPNLMTSYWLAKAGSHTVGEVVNTACRVQRDLKVSYRFTQGGREYVGVGKPGRGNRTCAEFEVGDQIFVTYLTTDPATNRPVRSASFSALFHVISAMAIFGALVFLNKHQTAFIRAKFRR